MRPGARRSVILAGLVTFVFAGGSLAGGIGATCGSRGMAVCDKGLFCDYEPKARCGAADLPGSCQGRPEICPMIYAPVCGCGGKTYGNDCERRSAGAGKLHDGECW